MRFGEAALWSLTLYFFKMIYRTTSFSATSYYLAHGIFVVRTKREVVVFSNLRKKKIQVRRLAKSGASQRLLSIFKSSKLR